MKDTKEIHVQRKPPQILTVQNYFKNTCFWTTTLDEMDIDLINTLYSNLKEIKFMIEVTILNCRQCETSLGRLTYGNMTMLKTKNQSPETT